MKPKLKNDTLYLPSAEGIYFVSNHGTLTLEGRHVYQWVDKLAPFLTGEHTLEQITAGLSEQRRRMVENLIAGLLQKGFVKDAGADRDHDLDAGELAAYESEIAFIDYYQDSAGYRFQQFRESTILLVGAGRSLVAAVQACLQTGARQVRLAVTGEAATDRQRIAEHVERARRRDPRQSLTEQATPDLDGADVVIHVSDKPMLDRARALNRACRERGIVAIQAVLAGDEAWVGPLVAGAAGACWECAWLRMLGRAAGSRGNGGGFADRADAATSEFLAGPTAAVVAHQAAFEVFKHLTGAGPVETAGAMVRIDLETLQSAGHPVTAHPLCTIHGIEPVRSDADFLAAVRRLAEGPEISAEAFSTAAAACFDERTGLLGSLDEGDWGQLPLKVSRAEYADALLRPDLDRERLAAVAVATDFTEARARATRRACELYAASAVRRPQLVGAGGGETRVRGLDLLGDDVCAVPATEVFPVLRGALPTVDDAPGLGSGFTWDEAVSRGLLGWANRITLAEIGDAVRPFPRVDVAAAGRTELVPRFLDMLDVLGLDVTVYDVTGSLGVPTLIACTGTTSVGSASGYDRAALVEAVLEQALRHHQAEADKWPAYAIDGPSLLPRLPANLRGAAAERDDVAVREWPRIRRELLARFRDGGHRPVAVPLDHDPVMHEVLPYVVNVVMTGGR
ncbi:TOMM precursor leader peptide-binding protein [Couchioplanes azureus]|uniref:TOMM precursor leader peptide-binding protein n=1 Tax=Couchioplanes caeruleus TaxID=56438 RepID=UPI001670AD00|nr:TOMM precursor leader peptide-binding protein [Couchioplanes caeruleus]